MRFVAPFSLLLAAILLSGCLTVETKEYRITLKSDNSGEAVIKFVNILSEADDTLDISNDDFQQLTEFYIQGTQLENENPGFRNVKKRLYEENGVLVGEVSFTFDSLSVIRLFQYDKESPYMYFVGNPLSTEQLLESNGVFGRDWMPIVFWPKETKEFYIKTKVVSEVAYQKSLLPNFREWQAAQARQKKQ
ncbi:MAG TPA: hypothetical protein VFG32_09915 [Bacteroidota bacterium]|nr:hypothetical protein [Bacteroidota bacterium]